MTRMMLRVTWRRVLQLALVADLLLACGGEASQAGGVGAGGVSAGGVSAGGVGAGGVSAGGVSAGGVSAGGGHQSGGSSSAGAAGTGVLCCNAFPVCPQGERTAHADECPGLSSCHQLSICCSSIWCVADAGGAGGAGGAGAGRNCFGSLCTATQACVAYRTEGGVALFADAGTCPTGEHLEGSRCTRDFAYECQELLGACQNQPVTCACAQPPSNNPGTCPANYGSCSAPDSRVDSAAQLVCQQLVP